MKRLLVELSCIGAALALAAFALFAGDGFFEAHVAPNFCIDQSTGPWQVVRVLAGGLAVVLALVLRPRLARMPARDLVGIGVAIVAALGVSELLLRRSGWDYPPGREDVAEVRADERLGWSYLPSRSYRFEHGDRHFDYAIDTRGERVRSEGSVVDREKPLLVLAGESVAFGHALDWDESFGPLVGGALGLEVLNLGVAGYANDQTYLRLLDALPTLPHPKIVVVVFVPIQIRRNLSTRRAHLDLDDAGKLVTVPPANGLAAWKLTQLVTDEPFHGRHALEVTRALLVATDAAIRASGAKPVFLYTNYGPACRDAVLEPELFTGLPVVRVDLEAADIVRPGDDRHPNPSGSRKIADAILSFVRIP